MGQETIGTTLRSWRKKRKISQLDLALEVGVSPKHISFVETGRSGASRKLILSLATALQLPAVETGHLLTLGGFSAQSLHPALSEEAYTAIQTTLQTLLDKHHPFPAAAVDAAYRFVGYNQSFEALIRFFLGADALGRFDNLLVLTFSPKGLRPYFPEADTLHAFMAQRIRQERHLALNPEIAELFFSSPSPELPTSLGEAHTPLPVVSFRMQKRDVHLAFFSVITTFGTPLDMRAGEFRIETLFPLDLPTETFLKSLI